MRLLKTSCVVVIPVALAAAQEASWLSKSVSEWNEDDAKQVLTSVSPWAKIAPAILMRQLTEDQEREAGRMGGAKGFGFEEVLLPTTLVSTKQHKKIEASSAGNLVIRWESAAPIHAAEIKLGAKAASEDYYAIEVYGVPSEIGSLNHKGGDHKLKKLGLLKRPGKKDVEPARIEILPESNDVANVVFLFPRMDPITAEDQKVEFVLHLGRIYVTQPFYPAEMKFQGKLQL